MEIVLAFGLLAVAILALIAMFTSGVKLSAQARNITVATELGKQVIERARAKVKLSGFSYLPAGTYTFDGRAGDPIAGTPVFPPAPYPSTLVEHQEYFVVVSGAEPSADQLKNLRVDVYWTDTSHISLETKFTP